MGKEYKPKYKLTIKYPRLPLKFESGDIVYYNALSKAYVREKFPHYAVDVNEVENNPDFWELIEEKPKPLFVTEDGVDKFYSNQPLWEVNKDFEKLVTTVAWVASKGSKYFSHEGNADKYIEDHKPKPLFITEDEVEVYKPFEKVIIVTHDFEKIYAIANQCFAEASSNKDKLFKQESNADEYIWRNMRLFSYEDVVEWYGYGFKLGREGIYETLERLAIERSK